MSTSDESVNTGRAVCGKVMVFEVEGLETESTVWALQPPNSAIKNNKAQVVFSMFVQTCPCKKS
jgi:hypothetical protein